MSLLMPNNALVGIAIQQDGVGTDHVKMVAGFEVPNTTDGEFYYYVARDLAFGPVKNQAALPPEIGGRALPSGMFVSGIWGAGGISMIPRLDNRFGWLLLAAMGDVSTVSDTTIAHYLAGGSGADAGINTHIFKFFSTDQFFTPYLTIRRLLPHPTDANSLGEILQDGRVAALTITGAAAAPITADLDVLARLYQDDYQFDFDPGWSASYDEFDHFPVANCTGHFKVESTTFQATAASVTVVNTLLPPAQSLQIGSVDPIDFPVLGRAVTVTATILIEDYALYVSTFSGATNDGATDANASCIIYKADVDVEFASQTYISGTEPYRLRLISDTSENNVAWQARPIRVQPNRPIVLQVTATVLSTETGDPFTILLQNAHTNYALP
ncbi:MAG TPA: phage tail tube protein [Anaerolineae bacterium]|nr:phage tail tube protein [Anaerolineae bacterium]